MRMGAGERTRAGAREGGSVARMQGDAGGAGLVSAPPGGNAADGPRSRPIRASPSASPHAYTDEKMASRAEGASFGLAFSRRAARLAATYGDDP